MQLWKGKQNFFPLAPMKKCSLDMEAGKFCFMKSCFLCLALFLATAEILNTKFNLFPSSMVEFD